MIDSKTKYSAIYEGFFGSNEYDPFPNIEDFIGEWKEEEKIIFLNKLKEAQKAAQVNWYKGSSHCRICGCLNGSGEYGLKYNGEAFIWPEGYYHYIEKHNIIPTKKFKDFILNF